MPTPKKKSTPKAKRQPRKPKDDSNITYYVNKANDPDIIIELPAHWKVTFGYVNPAVREQGYQQGHCLRAYDGEKLRFVMGDVTGFRDMDIPLARKVEKETGSSDWNHDSLGNFEKSSRRELTSEIIDDDTESPF